MLRQRFFGAGAILLAALGGGCGGKVFLDLDAPGVGGAGGAGGNGGSSSVKPDAGPDGAGGCSSDAECMTLGAPCIASVCVSGTCLVEPLPNGTPCDDGLFCTVGDACQGGKCAGAPLPCPPPPSSCEVGICDEFTKACLAVAGNDGTPCSNGDPCTSVGVCKGGACIGEQPVDCSALNGPCTFGVCDPMAGCVAAAANEGAACDDGLFCTANDHCQGGQCTGTSPCPQPGGCFITLCNEGGNSCDVVPGNDGTPCDDGNACTTNSVCANGACVGAPVPDGTPCDDGSACTLGELCQGGTCGGGAGPLVYFADDFHDNSKGWVLGTEWQIGPTKVSTGGVIGADPALDHTPTADNGVAGVVLGGNASTMPVHPFYWLESPTFSTVGGPGPVIFQFYRWLNSDYLPFMQNRVEVWNGAQWVMVWQSGNAPGVEDSPPQGKGWTYQQFDISAHKSASTRVRFGFAVLQNAAFSVGSWNVDDVQVANAPCQ